MVLQVVSRGGFVVPWSMWDEWSSPLDKMDLGRVSINSIQRCVRDRYANIEFYKYKTAASAIGVKHAFQDIPWHKLGTHSMKKTAVTLMAEAFARAQRT